MGTSSGPGLIRILFDEAFDQLKARYPHFKDLRAEDVRSSYFAERRIPRTDQTEAVDTTGRTKAERERRAKVIRALGELQASEKLSEAAEIIGRYPAAIQLRYLQTLREISSESNSTTLFPLPIDILTPFLKKQ